MQRWRDVKHKKPIKKGFKPKSPILKASASVVRVKAFVIDTFLILMPLVYAVFYLAMGSREEFESQMLLGWIYLLIPHLSIITLFWFFKSQTPGYKAYDIKLVSNNLQKPKLFQLIVRYVAFIFSFLSIMGLVLAVIRRDNRALHDIISGTMPIQTEK